ncbi:4Fe-4S dicluster domain-containing protein [Lutispora saccharofermentans]|uniref:Ferredoxin n=1 Tax=Lutispora saccharofermentans TaxID=3024236 RepID=A0ABT1NH80_9FIRM|nr:4Fe-4S binding protein [Lutispora saccharofermentans]MCQ1530655.1 4Fe-4S binding protein [Lutispora saccharofermentans]
MREMPAANPIIYDPDKCIGCNRCVEICQVDILIPNAEKGKPPIVAYPGECWYCGCCVMECPKDGAIKLRHPLMNQVHWVKKKALTEKEKARLER